MSTIFAEVSWGYGGGEVRHVAAHDLSDETDRWLLRLPCEFRDDAGRLVVFARLSPPLLADTVIARRNLPVELCSVLLPVPPSAPATSRAKAFVARLYLALLAFSRAFGALG